MQLSSWLSVGQMDDLGRLDSPVHRIDARVKAAVTFAFIAVVVSFGPHEVSALTPLAAYPLYLVAAGGIPVRAIARKILVASPFAVAVAIFNPLLDRETMVMVAGVGISGGWVSFVSVMLRFALTVGAALALVACTGMFRLGAGLQRLGVPSIFVAQLLFLYRYLFVVAEEAVGMVRSVSLRGGDARAIPASAYAGLVGHLLLRSMDRAARVHRAMRARGFDGTVRVQERGTIDGRSIGFAAFWLCSFAAARTWNLAEWLGGLIVGRGA